MYIYDYGKPTRYYRTDNFNSALNNFRYNGPFYRVPEELVDVCDQILRIMYAR